MLAFLTAMLFLRIYWIQGKSILTPELQSRLMTAIIAGVLIGGRLGYFLFYDAATLVSNPLFVFKVWDGGMASHGGFLGVTIAMIWFVRRNKLCWRPVADILVTLAPPGLLFGRVANFINGELWGKISFVPWAVIFPQSEAPGTPFSQIPPRHPSQLYEAMLEGVFLTIYTLWRFWKSDVTKNRPGHLSGEFLIAYAGARTLGELFREPDASLILGLNRGLFYSLFLALGGVLVIWNARKISSSP